MLVLHWGVSDIAGLLGWGSERHLFSSLLKGNARMAKTISEPDTFLSTPEYVISDQTAALKTDRLMRELIDYASPENWHRSLKELGFKEGISDTRRWRKILRLPQSRKDIVAACLDRNGEVMEWPDHRKTAEVMVWFLSSGTPEKEVEYARKNQLYLSVIGFKRSEVLHPEKVDYMVGASRTMLKVSFHALQRMIQRGYGLTRTEGVSYRELLLYLTGIWGAAIKHWTDETTFPATFHVEYKDTEFVIKVDVEGKEMTLVTMLPPKKDIIPTK
jgi:hypothetical protein